jgi:hypothetical protein
LYNAQYEFQKEHNMTLDFQEKQTLLDAMNFLVTFTERELGIVHHGNTNNIAALIEENKYDNFWKDRFYNYELEVKLFDKLKKEKVQRGISNKKNDSLKKLHKDRKKNSLLKVENACRILVFENRTVSISSVAEVSNLHRNTVSNYKDHIAEEEKIRIKMNENAKNGANRSPKTESVRSA